MPPLSDGSHSTASGAVAKEAGVLPSNGVSSALCHPEAGGQPLAASQSRGQAALGAAAGSGGASSDKADLEPSALSSGRSFCLILFAGVRALSGRSCCVSLTGGVSGGFLVVCFFLGRCGLGFLVRLRVLEALLEPALYASATGAVASGVALSKKHHQSHWLAELKRRDNVDLEVGTESVDFPP